MEIWRAVPNFEKYEVSNLGRIRSLKNNQIKILKPMVSTNGYLVACFWSNKKVNKLSIHRMVASLFVTNPFNYNEVNHIDENKTNNCASNLEWCSHKYNMNYGSIKEKIGRANKNRIISKETKMKLSMVSSNSRWLNDGKKESFAPKEKIGLLLEQGWNFGRLERR